MLDKKNNANAQYEIAYNHTEKEEHKKAHYWYKRSAKGGYSSAQNVLGDTYSEGKIVKRNLKKAFYWYKKSYKQNDSIGAYNMGCTYRDMHKYKKAFYWYQCAVKLNDYTALFEVGLCYLFGIGTKQNHALAYASLKEVLNEKNNYYCSQRAKENAQYWLGIFHLYGIGGASKSFSKARILLESADSDDDYDQANELLNLIGRTENRVFRKGINLG
jgi:TPR repeat protein